MDALVVLDDCLACYDMLVSRGGLFRQIGTGCLSLPEWGGKHDLKKCDLVTTEEISTNNDPEFFPDSVLSSRVIEKNVINLILESLNFIEETLKNPQLRTFCYENPEDSSENILPQPYSIIDSSCPKNHFDTVLITKSRMPHIESSVLVLSIHSYLASAITYTLMNNNTFCIGFSNFVRELLKRGAVSSGQHTWKTNKNKLEGTVSFLLHQPKKYIINYNWCYILQVLVTKRMILEELMAWLSTLGGGYSSLGDFVVEHAEEAGRISMQQLKIALELGDAIVQCKCRMFFALSLMQKGQLRKSKQLLRKEFMFITKNNFQDDKVKNICKALWIKLRYTYQERRTRNKALKGHANMANGTTEQISAHVS